MICDEGTDGISHTIHVATEKDGELTNFRKFKNVLDVMNLPDGTVKFYYEGDQKMIDGGRIVRSTVQNVDSAFRYRCSECEVNDTDIISQTDRGDTISMGCHICGKETEYVRKEIDNL